VTSILGSAFEKCSQLRTLLFEKGSALEGIGAGAFRETQITSVTFPPSVAYIETHAFHKCQNLTSVNFRKGSQLKWIGTRAFTEVPIKKVTIPTGVETIGAHAFQGCEGLKDVVFEGKHEKINIRLNAFAGTKFAIKSQRGDFWASHPEGEEI